MEIVEQSVQRRNCGAYLWEEANKSSRPVPLESIWAPPVQPESCDSVATNAVDATVPGAKLLSGSGSAAHSAAARPTPKMPLFPPHFDTTLVSN